MLMLCACLLQTGSVTLCTLAHAAKGDSETFEGFTRSRRSRRSTRSSLFVRNWGPFSVSTRTSTASSLRS